MTSEDFKNLIIIQVVLLIAEINIVNLEVSCRLKLMLNAVFASLIVILPLVYCWCLSNV